MLKPDWHQIVRDDLARLRTAGRLRSRRAVTPIDATHVEIAGHRLVNFASNDYLGLTHHPAVLDAARTAIESYGAGSGAAPLVAGYGPAHASAERAIAAWKGTEASLLVTSGFQANVVAVQTLAALGSAAGGTASVRFLLDKLSHASLVDAVLATRRPMRVFPHNHLPKLRRLLESAEPGQLQVVVTESIFSMDGDAADLAGLAALKAEFGFVLLLDEAHGSGVYGPAGAGYAAGLGLQSAVDITVVTLSKALGSIGGALCASQGFCDAAVNHGRPYVYSTMTPASAAAAAEAAIGVLRNEPNRQARVRTLARRFRADIVAMGLEVPMGDSAIVPVTLGTEQAALGAATALQDAGFLVVAIRPPTVPKGSSRLRITLSSEHSDGELEGLTACLRGLCKSR